MFKSQCTNFVTFIKTDTLHIHISIFVFKQVAANIVDRKFAIFTVIFYFNEWCDMKFFKKKKTPSSMMTRAAHDFREHFTSKIQSFFFFFDKITTFIKSNLSMHYLLQCFNKFFVFFFFHKINRWFLFNPFIAPHSWNALN